MTGDGMSPVPRGQMRLVLFADILRIRASRMEATARRRIKWARDFACRLDPLGARVRINLRYRREQCAGVRMARIRVNLVASGQFHDFAKIHNRYALADVLDDPQIVRNEKISKP